MILVEHEACLPKALEDQKAAILACLQTMHRVKIYHDMADLVDFLDAVLDGLVQVGAPRGLTRVLLFHRTPGMMAEVGKRMVPGGTFLAWRQPGCWIDLANKIPDLRAWAARVDPHFGDSPRGI